MLVKYIIFGICASIVDSGSIDCEAPFNSSDCGQPPKMVYTHFSTMSMCHPAIWKGCPSKNKFDDHNQCMDLCIQNIKNDGLSEKPKRCLVPLNMKRCSNQIKEVYTYNNRKRACIKAFWYGCPSENMFVNITLCKKNCEVKWIDKLAKDISEVKEVSDLFNKLMKKSAALKSKRTAKSEQKIIQERSG